MKIISYTAFLLVLCSSISFAQEIDLSQLKPENRFNFLIGTWEKFDGKVSQGKSSYRKIMKNLVIEQLDDWPKENESRAYLSYDKRGIWKHSWVDTWRYHLHYEGRLEGGKMILYQTSTYYESDVQQDVHARQVFHKISKDGFRWDWEISKDGGETWEFLNGLNYKRLVN